MKILCITPCNIQYKIDMVGKLCYLISLLPKYQQLDVGVNRIKMKLPPPKKIQGELT